MIGVLIIFFLALIGSFFISRYPETTAQQNKIEDILSVLPQTQCGKCNYSGCRPYAEAIICGEADINQCPPGGEATIKTIANLLSREFKPLNLENGMEKGQYVALIDETLCIGCVKCINACPVDAILGTAKQMHAVLAAECTGCELCIAPCPTDCISMQAITN